MNEAKGKDQEVEEDPDGKKQATATLINHPDTPLVEQPLGFVCFPRGGAGRVRPLEGLQTPPLGLVSLEVTRFGGPVGIGLLEIWVLVQCGYLTAVREVEARRPFRLVGVGSHGGLGDG